MNQELSIHNVVSQHTTGQRIDPGLWRLPSINSGGMAVWFGSVAIAVCLVAVHGVDPVRAILVLIIAVLLTVVCAISLRSAKRDWFCIERGIVFDSTMLPIGSMNMLLHGIKAQHTSMLANPPFAGSLDYEAKPEDLRRVVKTKKTELLFLTVFMRPVALTSDRLFHVHASVRPSAS